jgi:putative aldouronate transport system permease protein
MGDRLFTAVNTVLLVIIALVCFFPIYYVVVVSFTDPSEFIQKNGLVLFPENWSLVAYKYLLSGQAFIRATGVNIFLATVGTACSLAFTASLAYSLSRKRFKARRVIMLLILVTILFSPGIIPPYLVVRQLGLINSIWSLILPVLSSGWFVLLMRGFFDNIPDEIEDAARIDGANDLSIWVRIVLPLSLPALAAFGLFYAVGYWNTFTSALLYINDHNKWPLQMLLRAILIEDNGVGSNDSRDYSMDTILTPETIKMGAVVISTLPIVCVYPFLQKHFTKGMMLGSVK